MGRQLDRFLDAAHKYTVMGIVVSILGLSSFMVLDSSKRTYDRIMENRRKAQAKLIADVSKEEL